jgi:glycosyltransferase involved in cell wall biosynthesis
MRIRFVVREVFPEGGLSLAVFRLAEALVEAGHDADVLFGVGQSPTGDRALGHRLDDDALSSSGARPLVRALERVAPDLVLICDNSVEWLDASAKVAPTLLHTHLHWGVCADETRYWNRLRRPCTVHAGWRCVALRPLLGCADWRRTLHPQNVAVQQQMLELLASGHVGIVNVSTDQAELFIAHGVPSSKMVVVPNLGIRMTAAELDQTAKETPAQWRSAVVFIGRLSKTKGVQLLPALANSLGPDARLRIFGDGYLATTLGALPADVRCGSIDQREVAGVMMWARAMVFPSLWPEPGGIVGIDAQVMGVPLAAFDLGAARHWPEAMRFARGDVASMGAWIKEQPVQHVARDPEIVAARQSDYRSRIAQHASKSLREYGRTGTFEQTDDTPIEHLMSATGVSAQR